MTRGGLQIVPVKDAYMKVDFGDSVILGKNLVIGEYVLLGISPAEGEVGKLIIGDSAIIRSPSVIYAGS